MYATPHDHRAWKDHLLRVEVTLSVARWLAGPRVKRAADLSCGSGYLLDQIDADNKYYGDLADHYELCGPIEQTIALIPRVDLFVCSETIEHLDDPAAVLKMIRPKTRLLVLSTPVEAWNDNNPEHLWAWSRQDVDGMLADAGFSALAYAVSDARMAHPRSYQFGIWGCR